ncbi:hypothetical protein [Candidatus Thiodiazotropha endoloripes]|nr:hypothetical protein [Candidatus Thiodiazotropha endoloripes]MCG7983784.1 hypothetical protein [Candidatus Thiodiazotropha lotti]
MKNEKQSENNSESLMKDWTEEEIQEAEALSKEIKKELESIPRAEDTK